jgi:hypothetical protein
MGCSSVPKLLWVATVLAATGCGSTFPGEPHGSIQGRLFYDGGVLSGLENPGVGVYAMPSLDLSAIPNASQLSRVGSVPENGLEYTLDYLPPYSYTVIAQIVDLDAQGDPREAALAIGLALDVEVQEARATEDIDLTLADTVP